LIGRVFLHGRDENRSGFGDIILHGGPHVLLGCTVQCENWAKTVPQIFEKSLGWRSLVFVAKLSA
jgi:hypothetical protein